MRAVLALAPLLLAGCAGYRVLGPGAGGGRTLAVPPAANESTWIGLEVPLTRALREDAQRLLDVELSETSPALTLHARLVDPHRTGRVGLRGGAFALGGAAVEVAWELRDARGTLLVSGAENRELEFVTSLEETERAAYDQIFRQIAEKIVLDVAAHLSGAGPDQG